MVTTDHISPAGNIQKESPTGKYFMEHQILPKDYNSYGSRRGNHEVMMRGTFANIRIEMKSLQEPKVDLQNYSLKKKCFLYMMLLWNIKKEELI